MKKYDLIIKGDKVWDGESQTFKSACILISDGIIERIEESFVEAEAEEVIDATGFVVSPGFIDSHSHVEEDLSDPYTVQRLLLLQGVTTAVSGNCGSGLFMRDLNEVIKERYINLGFLTGHRVLREAVGIRDVYRRASLSEIEAMAELLKGELEEGSFGLSFGLEYTPEVSRDEIYGLAGVLRDYDDRFVSIHIRHDGPKCIDALREAISMSEDLGIRVVISHLGSMTAFGYAREALRIIEEALLRGVNVRFDSYPYAAFCTYIGSAVFDPGFEERWGKGLEALEVASGRFKGQRLTEDIFQRLREEEPETLIIAHVMNEDEMRLCIRHPMCAIASDGVIRGGWGHPRAAGAFPRGLIWLRDAGLSWEEALRHATTIPAENCFIRDRGKIKEGFYADIVVFDPENLSDRATFADPILPPSGIRYVIVNGRVAVRDGNLVEGSNGLLLRR